MEQKMYFTYTYLKKCSVKKGNNDCRMQQGIADSWFFILKIPVHSILKTKRYSM